MVSRPRDDSVMASAGDIRLRSIAFLPWDEQLEPVIGAPGPAEGAGAIEIPGRRMLPVRTWLEPVVGPQGVLGRIVDPDGSPRAVAVLVTGGATAFVETRPPLALVPGRHDFWSMDGAGLAAIDRTGEVRVRVDVTGIRALPGPAGGVWLLGAEKCWYVSDTGAVTEWPAPWRDPFDVCVDGDGLTGWDPDRRGGVVRLENSGALTYRDLGVEGALFERPLRFGAQELWASALRTLVHRGRSGERRVTLAGAGITEDGAAYLAGRTAEHAWLWRTDSPPQRLQLADGDQVVAVSGDRMMTWSGHLASWQFVDGAAVPDLPPASAQDVLEHGWATTTAYPFTSGPDGEVVVVASGPTGIVVLALNWPPEDRPGG